MAVAEVDLETMRCPDCADGYCRPLEDHSTRGVTVDGWSACSACKAVPPSQKLDNRLVEAYQQMMQVEALANLVENASHQGSLAPTADFYESLVNNITSILAGLSSVLHASHWILCRVYVVSEQIMRQILILGRASHLMTPPDTLSEVRCAAIRLCSQCAESGLTSMLKVIPGESHLAGVLMERAASARRAEANLLQQLSDAEADACASRATELELSSVGVLSRIWRVCCSSDPGPEGKSAANRAPESAVPRPGDDV